MTKEEALNIMSQMIKDEEGFLSDNTVEAHKMAIQALSQEPCDDAISRQAVMDALCDKCELFHKNGEQTCLTKCESYHFLATLPSVTKKPIERDDAISRQAVLDIDFKRIILTTAKPAEMIEQKVKALPLVPPQQKYGKWKVVSDGYGDNAYICECSECKDTVWVYKDADRKWKYCPSCGAKMQESEDKE